MKSLKLTFICLFLCSICTYGQTIQDLINEVDLSRLSLTLNEFTGEQSTIVDGNMVTITNRQQANNDLAADYLVEKFEQLDNLTITDQSFNSNGRNVIATQLGKTNPDDIYIVCAHYDTVADYCADDNATGTAAVLEVARILSTQCLDNTIVYALWDEEENGLNGSSFYANQAASNGANILGVLNMDMMGYDSDAPGTPGDNEFDIDVRDFADSVDMMNDIITVLNSFTFDLSVITVNPGTFSSDHSSFWVNGYSAVLLGESWETNDQTPFYHSPGDRVNTIDLPYFHELTKLVTAYMATAGGLVNVDNSVTQSASMLTANQSSASYQWINGDTNTPIAGATNQTYVPTANGTFAVDITLGNCTERSSLIVFDTLGLDAFLEEEVNVFPNPVSDVLHIESTLHQDLEFNLYDISGKLIKTGMTSERLNKLNVKSIPQGVYFLNIVSSEKSGTYKVLKE